MHEGGIGNYVAELAEGQGAKSLHICLMAVKSTQTIYPGIGRPARQRTFNLKDDPRSRYLDPMLANLLEAEWTLFDLRALRQAVREGVEVAPALADLVFGMDILVMVPEGTPLTRIR
jgi:hypothetical protein